VGRFRNKNLQAVKCGENQMKDKKIEKIRGTEESIKTPKISN